MSLSEKINGTHHTIFHAFPVGRGVDSNVQSLSGNINGAKS